MPAPSPAKVRLGILAMLGAMVIYGASFPLSRYGTLHGLRPDDIVFLRFAVAGPIMLPLFLRRGIRTCAGLGWPKGLALAIASGAPMALLMNTGLSLAPAAHGAALAPGTVTTIGVVYGIVVAGLVPRRLTILGLVLMLAGLGAVATASSAAAAPGIVVGDLLFFASGLVWGFYPIMLLRWRVDPMTAAAVAAVLSMIYLPVYLYGGGASSLAAAPWRVVIVQAAFQGPFNIIVGLWLWGWAARTLGPQSQLYPPLIPVLGTAMAIPALGEWPGPVQAFGLAMVVLGLALSALGNRQRPA